LPRQRIDRTHRVDGGPESVVFLAEPFDVAGHFRRGGQQLIERLAPFGLDPLNEPALAPQDLGALDLELVLFRAEHVEAFAGLFERRLRLRESRVRLLDACPGLPGRGVEGAERETTDRKSTRLNSSHEWVSYAVF